MKLSWDIGGSLLAGAILISCAANAQQRSARVPLRLGAYDVNHEATKEGTVLNFTENSPIAPTGAHVSVQTAAGTIDVHLGSASYLKDRHFSLAAGDSVKLIGAGILTNTGPVFLARIVQKGSQSIAVRSARGFLLEGYLSRQLPQGRGAQTVQQGTPQ
jgi:hypothetical protein